MKIVLANTVGVDSDGWSIIPYASRWTTASMGFDDQYTFYPRDLAYLSSLLKRDTDHDVKLVDGCLERYNKEKYAEVLINEKPDWLVFENSTRTFREDEWIARQVKEKTGAKIMITGQHVTAFPEEGLVFADTVVQGEFLKSALNFFKNGAKPENLIPFDLSCLINVKDLPFPEDDDVNRYEYAKNADLVCEYREIQIYATRGCPYGCVYCVARHSYFGGSQFRTRPVANVIAEIQKMGEKYPGLEGFFFDDEIHNGNIKYTKELARAIITARLNHFKYDAMCAYNTFDDESLELMKRAGYYKVRIGIETASDVSAEQMGLKGKHRPDKLYKTLETAKRVAIKMFGTFTLGGRGANEEEDRKTVHLMADLIKSDLLCDCQISICTPQPGTPFFDWAKTEGLLDTVDWNRFDGGEDAVISMPGYPAEKIKEMRKSALVAYDNARRTRDKKLFADNWPRYAKKISPAPRKILLFRSSRDWHLDNCFESILKTWNCEVMFLCHSDYVDEYQRRFPAIKLVTANDPGFLNWDTLGESVQRALVDYGADLALIPSNTLHCRSFGNVMNIAEKSQAQNIKFINACGELLEPND